MSAAVAPAAPAGGAVTIREFFEGVRRGRLIVQRCEACGELAVPPKLVCPACEGARWSPVPLAGDGEIASYTVIRVAAPRLAAEAPYVVALVRMREGVSLLGRLAGAPAHAVAIGMPVRFVPPPADADPPVIGFAPA